ncbi:Eukaryotic rRNA processing [Carpediemonas membranifera]|uniref:Eukaryotic rRNA processing n=1 Tax=Carpediemonas membranifera TaxID=201153 RepID=A0A8J6E2R8_9EUKA|nr:Eukaryotic rRNA processing [Carpediemonas membranifera]|eukprot:KAG9392227.1 Eukaryotic rRNA processing [Carpediemonas membranifera]
MDLEEIEGVEVEQIEIPEEKLAKSTWSERFEIERDNDDAKELEVYRAMMAEKEQEQKGGMVKKGSTMRDSTGLGKAFIDIKNRRLPRRPVGDDGKVVVDRDSDFLCYLDVTKPCEKVEDIEDDHTVESALLDHATACVEAFRERVVQLKENTDLGDELDFRAEEKEYLAEMVKSDEHMVRVKKKLVGEKVRIEAAEKARAIREQRKQKQKKRAGKKGSKKGGRKT